MPYDMTSYKDDEEDKQGGSTQSQDQAQPGEQVGQSGEQVGDSQEGGIVTGDDQKSAQGPSESGTFTNLQGYLNANKGNAVDIAGGVQKQIDEANQTQEAAGGAFRSAADAGTINEDKDLLDRLNTDPGGIVSGRTRTPSPFGDSGYSTPESNQNQSTSDFDRFVKMRDASYSGPKHLSDLDEQYQKAYLSSQKANETASQVQNQPGREAYLDNLYSKTGGYTSGMRSLDNLLIQQNPDLTPQYQALQKSAQDTGSNFSKLQGTLDEYAQGAAGTTAKTRSDYRGALGLDENGNYAGGYSGAIGGALSPLDQNVANRQAYLTEEQGIMGNMQYNKQLSDLTPNQLSRMGVDQSKFSGVDLGDNFSNNQSFDVPGGYFYGVNPGQYNQFVQSTDLNRGTVGTPEEMGKLSALSKLAGINQSFVGNPQDAGKYTSGTLTKYQGNPFTDAVAGKRNAYTTDMQGVINRYQGIMGGGGLVNTPDYQRAINDVREKYGLPRTGSEVGSTTQAPSAPALNPVPGTGPNKKLPSGGYYRT